MSIEIANESGVSVDVHALERLAQLRPRRDAACIPLVELSIRLVDVDAMTALHVHFMNEPGPTDVLAFPMDELHDQRDDVESPDAPPTLLGDVVLCPEVAARQAQKAGHSTRGRAAPAVHARHPAPARLRPRRPRRGTRDVRPADAAAGRLGEGVAAR